MKILSHYLQGKHPNPDFCEDGWVATDHFAAVVDGSTSKVPGRRGGREAMLLVTQAIKALPCEATMPEVVAFLTQMLAAHNPPESVHDAAYRLTCSVAIYSRHHREVWIIGDCQCRFQGCTYHPTKYVDDLITQMRVDIIHHLLSRGYTADSLLANDLARAFLLDALKLQTNFQNDSNPHNPYAYPVLDGTPVNLAQVKVLQLPAACSHLILASDGYPRLFDTLSDTESSLSSLLQSDALCIDAIAGTKCLQPSLLSFDDRCFLDIAP